MFRSGRRKSLTDSAEGDCLLVLNAHDRVVSDRLERKERQIGIRSECLNAFIRQTGLYQHARYPSDSFNSASKPIVCFSG